MSKLSIAACLLLSVMTSTAYVSASYAQNGTVAVTNRGGAFADTPEARRAAEPLPWNSERSRPDARLDRKKSGPPGVSRGGDADPGADAEARRDFPEDWKLLEQEDEEGKRDRKADVDTPFGTADVYTQYCENCERKVKRAPQNKIGKLLFTNRSGGTSSCTASVISGNNIIVTAAHCCYERGAGFFSNWRFMPAYRDGAAPYGTFPFTQARVLNAWISSGGRQNDVCVMSLGPNAKGQTVTSRVGWMGRSWNWGTIQSHHAMGYPGNVEAGGNQIICAAESFQPSDACGGAAVLNMGCGQTFGSSGGPWVRGWRGGGDWVNAVVSGYDSAACTGTFGATFNAGRFTDANIVALCTAQGC